MDRGTVLRPEPWVGKRWREREFAPDTWNWAAPSKARPLDILVRNAHERVRMGGISNHVCSADIPADAIIWLDEHTTMPAPPLLFTQMAETASIPALVLLGHELCGHFSRSADFPGAGHVTDNIPAATSVAEIVRFLDAAPEIPGRTRAREAIRYVADHALSVPEAVLSTMYALPVKEAGYGMGPIALNRRIETELANDADQQGARYPDLLFPFAPVGVNYDGEAHLDLNSLVLAARKASLAEPQTKQQDEQALSAKLLDVREKAVDDIRRTRELAASGYIVLPATKEDLYDWGALDSLTMQILSCAHTVFGADIQRYRETLENTELARDRSLLLSSLVTGRDAPVNRSEIL